MSRRSRVLTDEQVIALAQLGSEVRSSLRWDAAGHRVGDPRTGSMYVVQTRPDHRVRDVVGGKPARGGRSGAVARRLAAAPGVATGHVRILMSPEHWRRVNPG